MLTKAEMLVAADCAEAYPAGWSESFFWCRFVKTSEAAAAALQIDPELVKFG